MFFRPLLLRSCALLFIHKQSNEWFLGVIKKKHACKEVTLFSLSDVFPYIGTCRLQMSEYHCMLRNTAHYSKTKNGKNLMV